MRSPGNICQSRVAAHLAAFVMVVFATVVRAHDFGGPTGGGGDSPPPPTPPCNECPCSGPGGAGGGGGPGNGNGNPGGSGGKPVSFYHGAEEMTVTDLVVNGVFPIQIQRKYDSRATYDSALGYGWSFLHDRRLYEYPDNSILVRHGCGTRDRYIFSGGSYVTPTGSLLAQLTEQAGGSFRLAYLNGVTDFFDSQGRLTASSDAKGNRHEYTYDPRGKLPLVGSSKESVAPTQPMTVAYNYQLTRIDVRGADGVLTGRYVTFAYDRDTGRLTSVTADDGRSVTYAHDVTGGATLGNLTQVNGLEGLVSTYGYADPLDPHNMTSITTAQGRTPVVNTYDAQDRVIRQEEGTRLMTITYDVPYTRTTVTKTIKDHDGLNPYTAVSVYEFDTTGRVSALISPLGHETRYTYNAAKLLARKEIWQKDGGTLSLLQAIDWTYDANGNKLTEVVQLDGGETITRSWTYDHDWIASEQVVSSAAPARIFRTEYTFYYGADGRPTNVQSAKRRRDDGSWQTTTYSYDGRNRLLMTTLPDSVQIVNEYTGEYVTRTYFAVAGQAIAQLDRRFGYDAQGNRIKEWDARNNLTQYTYDDRGRMTSTTNPLGEQEIFTYVQDTLTQTELGRTVADGEGQVTKYVRDTRGRLIALQRKNDAGVLVDWRTFQLDSEGQRIGEIDGIGNTIRSVYDVNGNLASVTDAAGNVTSYGYDGASNRTLARDALNREIRYEYDDLNRLTAVVQMGVAPQARTEYAYDAAGNRVSIRDAENHVTTYLYDALSHNVGIVQSLGQAVQYVYDDRDRIDYSVTARGHKVEFDYEPWGGIRQEREYASVSATTPDRTTTFVYDNDGNVTSVIDDAVQATPMYATTYDALGRKYDETIRYVPGGDRVLSHRYDRFGNRRELAISDGGITSFTHGFNKLNQLATATLAGASINLGYYGNDTRQSVSLPNGVTEGFTYRPNGPIESVAVNGPGGPLQQLSYTYDDVNNVDTMTDAYGLHAYTYDGLNRLTGATRPPASGLPNESYAYDRVGNREDPANAALYSYDSNNRITASPGLTYSFDDDGNLQSRSSGTVLAHDIRNRMTQFTEGSTVVTFLHDSDGRRIRKSSGGVTTWFVWDDLRLIAEYDQAGNRTKRYAYLGADHAPKQVQDAQGVHYVHADHLQAPRLATDSAGAVAWRMRLQAFGSALVEGDVDANGVALELNTRFPGQYFDQETGLHYNLAREYDPTLGRYVQSDPIGVDGGINTYLYVRANPLRHMDPTGLATCGSGWNEPFVPDNPFGFPFSDCCVAHDDCYGDCENRPAKSTCDNGFRDCMLGKCRTVWLIARLDCARYAYIYYAAVRYGGQGAFDGARANCPPCNKK